MRRTIALWGMLLCSLWATAQPTFPVNGVAEPQSGCYAFTNATIVQHSAATLTNATLVIRDGRIVAVGNGVPLPKDAVVVDCNGKFIYPSFIDAYSTYGMPALQRGGSFDFRAPAQLTSNQKGAYGWNQALRTDIIGARVFTGDPAKAKSLRDAGFGVVGTHHPDGIAQGTGLVATLADLNDNKIIIKEKATAHFSFSKGTSTQSYPSSLMGSIALLRQTFMDADWYKTSPKEEGVNLTLRYFNEQRTLPMVFDAGDKWQVLRADKLGDEFGVQFIMKAGGNEYQRIADMKATNATFIVPLSFPDPMDVDDPADMRFVGVDQLKHWEMAPSNAAAFEKAGIPFCLTTADLGSPAEFMANLRKAMEYGLTEKAALDALTKTPATLLGVSAEVGSIEAGKLANFMICSAPVFSEKNTLYSHWLQGKKHTIKEEGWYDVKGTYKLTLMQQPEKTFSVELKDGGTAVFIDKDTLRGKYSYNGKMVKLSYPAGKSPNALDITLSGVANQNNWSGQGLDAEGKYFLWKASLEKLAAATADSTKPKAPPTMGSLTFPFLPYGNESLPTQQTLLIKNATVWTNEKEGRLDGADVLVRNGKIEAVGKGLTAPAGAKVIDGTGKHLTPGIIDEHSHIAAASINEGAQSVTSEVRIQDNLNPEDINIYRQLSGGVTTSHILHGSANTIGGQTQLIKLRWGANDKGLMFEGAPGFIKFALGENVKRSSSTSNNRFPDTRMGVEQVLDDAFARARDYEKAWKAYAALDAKTKAATPAPRRDLELDALVEILNSKRFITCHSYVQSEIVAMMRIAEKYGFTLNTFTHILEGYKVADKMKAHGANASSFSDWWNYKMEVVDAIPQSPAIMHKVGLNVAINSDDAEMARRLNQEAAKSIRYGGLSEEDALKMVTLNPAKMLHVDNKVGSIKTGKDADLVLWSDNPLSIYAKSLYTIVDGTVYYDREKDEAMRDAIRAEKQRLVAKIAALKKGPAGGGAARTFQRPMPRFEIMHNCTDHNHSHGILVIDGAAEEKEAEKAVVQDEKQTTKEY